MFVKLITAYVFVTISSQVKSSLKNGDEERTLEMYQRFFAGASAGIVAQTAIYPMEVSCRITTNGKIEYYFLTPFYALKNEICSIVDISRQIIVTSHLRHIKIDGRSTHKCLY